MVATAGIKAEPSRPSRRRFAVVLLVGGPTPTHPDGNTRWAKVRNTVSTHTWIMGICGFDWLTPGIVLVYANLAAYAFFYQMQQPVQPKLLESVGVDVSEF